MKTRGVQWGLALLVAGIVWGAGDSVSAGWGSYGSYGGSAGWSPGWASCGSSGGSSGYVTYGSWGSYGSHGGPVRSVLRGLFHHHHYGAFYSCGSSGGMVSWGSYGSWGSFGCTGGTYYYHPPKAAPSAPMAPPAEQPMAPPAEQPKAPPADQKPNGTLPPPGSASAWYWDGSALLTVSVPESARVYVNGLPTTSTGSERRYISRGLRPGMAYTYEVRAEVTVDGQTVEETKTVELRAGDTARLEFRLEPRPETVLTLHVPEDARVTLAGHDTSATGQVRVFRSRALAPGQTWENYRVRVSVERDGRTLVKEETLTLRAGEQRELQFDFGPATAVASR
ncbi:MAG: hypothetical protein KatS3mg110_1166 [Pirellulaceae bacterium]|nr:MAG: hypothetical protein KatS3mg110_1166 [Pirellulaceae bacterium]